MRFSFLSTFCMGLLVAAYAPVRGDDFTLRAEVVEALEGGPLVVKATLSYGGAVPIRVFRNLRGSGAFVTPPLHWVHWPYRIVIWKLIGSWTSSQEFNHGDEAVVTLMLHHEYKNIPKGPATLEVNWPVYAPSTDDRNHGRLITDLSVPLEVDIPPASPERLAALRKRMEERLRQPDLSHAGRRVLGQDIVYTGHCVLVPVAWQMIESPRPLDPTADLIKFVSESTEDSQDFDVRLAKLATNSDWSGEKSAFHFWWRRKTPLAPDAWRTLTQADSVWTRALTYATFPDRCGKEWKEKLFNDLREQSRPLPSAQLAQLLADLDNDDFEVREKASARLERFGERVEVRLRQSLESPLPSEARQRVVNVLDKLREAKQPPDCARALDCFWSHNAPDRELLQVLAEGEPDAWLTQQAKEKLAEWRKDRGLPDK